MYHTTVLNKAIEKARECNCIICMMSVINLESAEQYWKDARQYIRSQDHRKWARNNWRRAAERLINPQYHLKGGTMKMVGPFPFPDNRKEQNANTKSA